MRAGADRPALTRRKVLSGIGALGFAHSIAEGRADQSSVVSGTVFHDRTGSGRRRWGSPGVPGVMVSNGRNVVKTDEDGRWRLPATDGDIIFVIKPAGWATPAAGTLPRFSYRFRRQGGSEADGPCIRPAAADVDFPLTPAPEPAQFEALLFADTQPANGIELSYLSQDIIAAAAGQGAAFGINHGDVVFDAHALYPHYLQALSASGVAWHHCPGNHDIDYGARDDGRSRETWQRVFGPRHYAFQHGRATFILLDNVYYDGCDAEGAAGGYCGRIGPDQLQFVRSVLAGVPPDDLVVVSMHIPLINYQDAASAADNTRDADALLRILSSHRHSVSFSGHMHSTEHHYLGANAGPGRFHPHHHHVLTAASGSWWGGPKDARGLPTADSPDGNPNGFHVLSVDGRHYTTRFVPALGKGPSQMRLLVEGARTPPGTDGHFQTSDPGGCTLVANVFDGGPRTRVTFEAAGMGAAQGMSRTAVTDPFLAGKPWARAVPSSHVWKARLPEHLEAGVHRFVVRATDEYGRSHRAEMALEVSGDHGPA